MGRIGIKIMDLGNYIGTFVGTDLLGFEKGKKYNIEIDKKPNYPYEIYEESGLYLILSSEISIRSYFADLKKV